METAKPQVQFKEGQSTTAIYAVKSRGINPMNGKEVFEDLKGNLTYELTVVLVIGASSGHIRAAVALVIAVATNNPKHPLAIRAPAPAKQIAAKLHRRSVFMLSQLPRCCVMIISADNT